MAFFSSISISGLLMPTKETDLPKKTKTTVYMTGEEQTLLNELFIKRLKGKTENGQIRIAV
jgi:hypothetical protein